LKIVLYPVLTLLPLALWAQENPAQGTVFTYDEAQIDGILEPSYVSDLTIQVIASDSAEVAVFSCRSSGECDATIGEDFLRFRYRAYTTSDQQNDFDFDKIADWPDVNAITTYDASGGDMFPLENGKTLRWTEIWTSFGYNAVFEISIEQTCCKAPSDGFSVSDELWELRLIFQQTEGDGYSEGEQVYLFDPALNWYVSANMRVAFRDDDPTEKLETSLSRQVLRSVRQQ